jgi:hypothetical protein
MNTSRTFVLALLALLSSLLGPATTSARAIMAMPPPTSISDVQAGLAAVEPEVQQCAASTSTTSPARVMVNVHLFPQGMWSVSFGAPPRTPAVGARGSSPFEGCVANAIMNRIGPRTERFTGTRPRTVSRRFRLAASAPVVTPTAPTVGPVTAAHAAVLRRVLASRRTEIQACFPHAARAPRSAIRLRLEISPSGQMRITGLRMPAHVDFANVAQCLERALDGATGPTSPSILRGEIPFTVQIDAPAADAPAGSP